MPTGSDGEHEETRGGGRFTILRRVGEGGMGVVYEALDRVHNARVALKTLPNLTADGILRFKNEFRALSHIQHPNLVGLGELHEDGGQWFFTMDLVSGVDFLRHVGRDDAKLRSALAQVTHGLLAIHAEEKVHRDIKPSNILVTAKGLVKILDFGLIAGVASDSDPIWGEHLVVGTPTFMAPEQSLGVPVGPEADWYSVGVLLYVALTGRAPFAGGPERVFLQKQIATPLPPAAIADVPPDLDDLCCALLVRDPKERANGRRILEVLNVHESVLPPVPETFVGRSRELATLVAAYGEARTKQVTVLVHGESGVGKTALVARFTAGICAADATALVLRGRCYERESVPFKAFDGIIDALSAHLLMLLPSDVEALLPDDVALVTQVFPVLRRVPVFDNLAPASQVVADAPHLRRKVFAALRTLFGRLAAKQRVAIVVDDLQWTDADSLALLRDLQRAPNAPPILFVATTREVSKAPAAHAFPLGLELSLPGDVRHIHVTGLPTEHARELVTKLLEATGPLVRANVLTIAKETAGHPLYITELVRHARAADTGPTASLRLEDAVSARLRALDANARKILELLVVAGVPMPLDLCARAAGIDFGELTTRVAVLRAGHLVRTSGARATDRVEPYHDRVRAGALALLEPGARKAWHGRLALAIENSNAMDPESLAFHWQGAGNTGRAIHYAVLAAKRAATAFAFHRAAQLYEMALDLVPDMTSSTTGKLARLGREADPTELRTKLAEMRSSAGHGREAASAYLAAAETTIGAQAKDLRRRAAAQLFAAGHLREGGLELERLLAELDLSPSRSDAAALLSMHWHRAQLRLRGIALPEGIAGVEIAPDDAVRIDACGAAALAFETTDAVRASDFQARQVLFALRAGEPSRICRALAHEMVFAAAQGEQGRVREARGVAEAAAERVGRPADLRARIESASAAAAFYDGRWADALSDVGDAEVHFRARWTDDARLAVDTDRLLAMSARCWMGRVREWHEQLPALYAELSERDLRHLLTSLVGGVSVTAWLSRGDATTPLALNDEAIAAFARASAGESGASSRVSRAHVDDAWARAQIALYEGDAARSLTTATLAMARLSEANLDGVVYLRVVLADLRGRALIALAKQDAGARAKLLRRAEADIDTVAQAPITIGAPLAALLRAGVANVRGEDGETRSALREALDAFHARQMDLHAAVTRRRLGSITAGSAGKELVALARAWMGVETVKSSRRIARLLSPGWD